VGFVRDFDKKKILMGRGDGADGEELKKFIEKLFKIQKYKKNLKIRRKKLKIIKKPSKTIKNSFQKFKKLSRNPQHIPLHNLSHLRSPTSSSLSRTNATRQLTYIQHTQKNPHCQGFKKLSRTKAKKREMKKGIHSVHEGDEDYTGIVGLSAPRPMPEQLSYAQGSHGEGEERD
jgi:hypothetical protein